MPAYDYKCRACGHRDVDVTFTSWRHAPQRRRCPSCSKRTAYKVIGVRNFIHMSLSSLYDRPEPALGYEKFGSYDRKKKLLREWNVEEGSDPVKGARQYRPEIPPPRTQGSPLVWGGDMHTVQ